MNLRPLAMSLPIALVLIGCTQTRTADEMQSPTATGQATQLRLPNGLLCRWQPGTSPDGPYACASKGETEIRIAAPPLVTGTTVRATLAVRERMEPLHRRALVAEIEELVLSDGTICRNAGRGATAALDGQRLTFSCEGGEVDGLIGTLHPDGERFVATAVTLRTRPQGLRLAPAGRVPIAVIGLAPEDPA